MASRQAVLPPTWSRESGMLANRGPAVQLLISGA
jgi:hypothetical protein